MLAQCPGRSMTTAQIAEQSLVPAGYLSKVLQMLVRAGVVTANRGLHGGYQLKRSPQDISVLDIINAVDPIERIHVCPLGLAEHTELCPLHRKLDDAVATIEQTLGATNLHELLIADQDGLHAGLNEARP